MSTNHAITEGHVSGRQDGTHGRALRVAIIFASLVGVVLAVALLATIARGVVASPTATTIDHVCVNKSSGQLFYLSSCKKSQTETDITSTATQFKACYLASNGVTRKVSANTRCSDGPRKKENTILKVPADSNSLYFCVGTDGTMYFKGTDEPTCSAGQFAVVIGPHNRPPTATNDSYSTDEDTPLNVGVASGVLSNDSDPDGDAITAQLVTGPAHKTSFTLNADGSFTYAPAADYNGPDSFTYKAKDSHGSLSSTTTVNLTVTPVNDTPTDISLSPSSVAENQPSGTTVGPLSSSDVDAGDNHTYTLVSGAGDDDNAKFQISNGELQTNATFDFETKSSYTVRVRTDDGNGGTFEKQLTISITDANDAPTDITLSNNAVDENQPAGTDVGTLTSTDQDAGDSFTYTLVSGAGDDDNASFQISGSTLQTAGPLNFEDGTTLSVRVRTSDGHTGGTFEEQLTITLGDLNDAPTNLALSNATVEENQPSGATVGTLSADDEDGDTPTFAFATGTGDDDNGSFTISGNTLKTNATFDFEAKDTYTIRVEADDGNGGTVEKQFTITVTNANDAPTDIALSDSSVAENQPSGTDVGTLSTTDQDTADTHTYTLVSGAGDTDNASFQIVGDTLQTSEQFDFEAKDSYTVRLQTDDGNGGTTSKQFTISITDANDAPTDISLSDSTVIEHQPSGTLIGTFSTTDQDTGDTFTYSFVTGTGDTDNASFQISGDELQTDADLAAGTYSVRVQTSDGNGGTFEKQFTITVVPPNFAPTDIALTNDTVEENQPSGTTVGTLSTTDQDSGDTHTYTLVSGAGDTDNASFQIVGDTLQTSEQFDFEAKDTYTIRVRTDDGHTGGTFEESFTITITDANDAPTDMALSNSSVAENLPSGTDVGTLSTTDQDSGDTHTYTLVSGAGDTDNASFQISGDMLQTNDTFDFEAKDSYTVRLQTDDGNGGTTSKQFTISITDANDAPTDIALSDSSVAENLPSGTDVGTFTTTDQDTADTHTYTLVSGTGDTDNGQFTISGDTLKTNAQFNFEVKNSYSIRVQTDDGNGGTSQKQFTVTVTNANDAPTNIALSNSSVAENLPSGTTVGTLSSTDEDTADTHTYTLVAGAGDTDNSSFQISGSTLQTNAAFDFEAKNSYTIRLQTSDGQGGTFDKQFTITVTNANDAPTDIALSKSDVNENLPSGTPVGNFSTTDQDSADTHTYTLVTGTGSTDNSSFQIVNGELRTNASFNFEAKNSYSIRVRTTDSGTPAQFFEEAFTISINDQNDAPVAGTDSYSGVVGNTKASVGVTVTGEPVVALTGNVLTFNDSDEDATFPHTLSAVQETVSSTGGGTATINSDGSFTFVPGVGDKNQSDTFTYKVTDGQATSSGTVTVGISNTLVWYVDNAKATNGDGRSSSPFNSLAGVNGAGGSGDADSTGDFIFLFQGSGNYTGGLPLEASQKLIGQAANLTVGFSTLLAGDPAKRPTVTNAGADAIDLDDANEVRGLQVDPSGTGGGIAGSSGDTGGATIDDVRVIDSGTLGTQPGLELDSTTGTFNISNLTVSTSGATGVRLNNAGTTNFLPTGTISITTSGAKALDATGALATPTNMGTGSVFDDITVTGSGAGGVSMSGTTGTTTFGDGSGTDLALTTTSGATPAFGLSNAGTVSVPSSGTANVSATGGPAVDISGTSTTTSGFNFDPGFNFDDVDSTGSANDGINIDGLGTGTFSATSGDIGGASGIAFDLNGGSGNITYPGNLNNGTGQSAEITGRSGGAVALSGPIADSNDTGGGISMSGNTGGSTTFSNATKTLNTGASAAFSSTGSNHTINFTNGGLDIDTTSGAGFSATGGGTVTVGTGTNPNTIDSTTGTALNVANTTIGASSLTFRSISANGAANGIVLNNTGSSAGLTVTGLGSTAKGGDNSGGTIQNTTGDGISLTNTRVLSFNNMNLQNTAGHGINGTGVNTSFSFTNGKINGAGDATDESCVSFDDLNANNVSGTVTFTNNQCTQTEANGVDIENWGANLSDVNISDNQFTDTGDVATPGSAVLLIGNSSPSTAGVVTKAALNNNTITDFRAGAGFVLQASQGTGPAVTYGVPGNATNVISVTGNSMDGGNAGIGNQPDRFVTGDVNGNGQGNYNVSNNGTAANRIQHIDCIAIELGKDGPGTLTTTVQNNFINANSAVGCAGIAIGTDDPQDTGVAGTHSTLISGNNVMGTDGPGIFPIVRDSISTMTARVINNTVAAPITTNSARAGIRVDSGSAQGDTTMCLEISGNTTAGSTNSGTGTTSPGINLRKQGTDPLINTFGIEGMAATTTPGVENYVNGLNTSTSGNFGVGGTALLSATQGFSNCNAP